MKRIFTKILLVAGLGSALLVQTGCFGSFTLVRKVYQFNKSLGDKFIQEIVFLAFIFIPVYSVAGFIDAVFLNLLEFWTGSNPVAMKPGQVEVQTVAYKGKTYEMRATQNQFEITELVNGKRTMPFVLNFSTANSSWTMNYNGKSTLLSEINSQGELVLHMPDGSLKQFNVNENGLSNAIAYLQNESNTVMAAK